MSKFHAVRTTVDGTTFASKAEAARYLQLKQLERAGEIGALELQPSWTLHAIGGQAICRYLADFRYVDHRSQQTVVEDVKGVRTPVYNLKAKWMLAEHGVRITEVTMPYARRRARSRRRGA